MFNKFKGYLDKLLCSIDVLSGIPLSPNSLTVLGLALSATVPASAYAGFPPYVSASLILVSSLFDALDGYVARRRGARTEFGAFLDSTSDRVSDAMYTVTLMLYGLADGVTALALLTAEFLISYTRARAEGLGVNLSGVGFAERGERILLKITALLVQPLSAAAACAVVLLLLLLSALTTVQRVYAVRRALKRGFALTQLKKRRE